MRIINRVVNEPGIVNMLLGIYALIYASSVNKQAQIQFQCLSSLILAIGLIQYLSKLYDTMSYINERQIQKIGWFLIQTNPTFEKFGYRMRARGWGICFTSMTPFLIFGFLLSNPWVTIMALPFFVAGVIYVIRWLDDWL